MEFMYILGIQFLDCKMSDKLITHKVCMDEYLNDKKAYL